jgi:hypothetical protein
MGGSIFKAALESQISFLPRLDKREQVIDRFFNGTLAGQSFRDRHARRSDAVSLVAMKDLRATPATHESNSSGRSKR